MSTQNLVEALLMSTHNMPFDRKMKKLFMQLSTTYLKLWFPHGLAYVHNEFYLPMLLSSFLLLLAAFVGDSDLTASVFFSIGAFCSFALTCSVTIAVS